MATTKRWVYSFGDGKADGRGDQKELLGGKGAGLAEMTRIGLPVPRGFTIATPACAYYHQSGGKWPPGLESQVRHALTRLERSSKKKLGDANDPLLISVRSGAARSMPGMMETILNLGLNDRSVEGLAAASRNRRFALDAYRRFIMMYGATAMGIDRHRFDEAFDRIKQKHTRPRLARHTGEKVLDTDASAGDLEHLVVDFQRMYRDAVGDDFPQDPWDQLQGAINAVFRSWMADKAVTYRRVENITGLSGTAVNVCQMVYGNLGADSGTGVCFTRDPSTGEPELYGDLLINAQGEDVVAGIRTPMKLSELKTLMPNVYDQLEAVRVMLEVHYHEMQDLEFTIERGTLYMLQCRAGKRSPRAAFKIAVDQATRGLLSRAAAKRLVRKKYLPRKYAASAARPVITRDDAILRIQAVDIERLFYPVLDPHVSADELSRRRLTEGIGAVPGAACGEIVFSADEAERRTKDGKTVILVRKETSPEDVGGMYVAAGILTATGGKTSHAAVVARGWGKCCIVGCEQLTIDYGHKRLSIQGRSLREGDAITLDGGTGRVFSGKIPLVRPDAGPEYATLMAWCDQRRRLRVRTNADTPQDAAKAVEFGAEGIGLCRTEHMFFDPSQPQRITAMREMIIADNEADRRRALAKLLPFQRADFEGIFKAMNGKPVTIRLLDPPLHEFLPHHDNPEAQQAVADELNGSIRAELAQIPPNDHEARRKREAEYVSLDDIRRRVEQLKEANPMLGHRGCRLCITYPEILEMQVRAIIEAAVDCASKGVKVLPEIMIPLSIDPKELALLIARTRQVAEQVLKEHGAKLSYLVGTMIETPRAAILAGSMADSAEFFSFGTNDLTQLTLGLSRDDAGRFLPDYLAEPRASAAVDTLDSVAQSLTSNRQSTIDNRKLAIGNRPLAGPILPHDPFQSIDVEGVGLLMRTAVEEGRGHRPNIKLGVCGEHGGDPASVRFCEQIGLDYVSCSPFRVPIARLAAAQASIVGFQVGPRIVKSNAKPVTLVQPTPSRAKSGIRTPAHPTRKRKPPKRS